MRKVKTLHLLALYLIFNLYSGAMLWGIKKKNKCKKIVQVLHNYFALLLNQKTIIALIFFIQDNCFY
jgi:hypothetical protein